MATIPDKGGNPLVITDYHGNEYDIVKQGGLRGSVKVVASAEKRERWLRLFEINVNAHGFLMDAKFYENSAYGAGGGVHCSANIRAGTRAAFINQLSGYVNSILGIRILTAPGNTGVHLVDIKINGLNDWIFYDINQPVPFPIHDIKVIGQDNATVPDGYSIVGNLDFINYAESGAVYAPGNLPQRTGWNANNISPAAYVDDAIVTHPDGDALTNGRWTTEQFIAWLRAQGFIGSRESFTFKFKWEFSRVATIIDVPQEAVGLAGAVCKITSSYDSEFAIEITHPRDLGKTYVYHYISSGLSLWNKIVTVDRDNVVQIGKYLNLIDPADTSGNEQTARITVEYNQNNPFVSFNRNGGDYANIRAKNFRPMDLPINPAPQVLACYQHDVQRNAFAYAQTDDITVGKAKGLVPTDIWEGMSDGSIVIDKPGLYIIEQYGATYVTMVSEFAMSDEGRNTPVLSTIMSPISSNYYWCADFSWFGGLPVGQRAIFLNRKPYNSSTWERLTNMTIVVRRYDA